MRLIEKQYLELKNKNKYNNVELAKMLNVSVATIFNLQKKFNLKSDFKYNYIKKISLVEISALVGTILGDSWLTKGSKSSYRGGFAHKETNKDYVIFKKEILKSICVNNVFYKINKHGFKNGKNQYVVKFKSSPFLKEVYNNIYINKNKKINKYVLNHFTDLSLALYYQDDGSKRYGKNGWYSYKIAMYSFDKESKLNLKKLLLNKWNIHSTVTKNDLNISAKSKLKFKTLISPYIVGSMKYKL